MSMIAPMKQNVIPVRESHPDSGDLGEMYFNSKRKCVFVFTGEDGWFPMSQRPSHIKNYEKEFRL